MTRVRAIHWTRGLSIALLAAPASAGLCRAQVARTGTPEQRFFEWTDLRFAPQVFALRRTKMVEQLRASGNGVLLVPSAEGTSGGETFRQLDDFLYFTGLEVPRSVLAIDARDGRSTLFTPHRDARFENAGRRNDFPGRPLADDPEISRRSGLDAVLPYESLDSAVASWVGASISIRLDAPGSGGPAGQVVAAPVSDYVTIWSPVQMLAFHLLEKHPGVRLLSAGSSVARLRMVKGGEEIEVMRRVASITAQAIREAAGHVRDGIDERSLEAELEAAFKRRGGQRLGFASIIKSGPNSLWAWRILAAQYDRRNRSMHGGELVIFDVGTELDGYTSDVGRTFPVSGRFTAEQRERLELITRVSDAIIAAIRPGITLADLTRVAMETIPAAERTYMQTPSYFGHHVGLSSGDPGLPDAPLEPGMIFTVEPWYYNHDLGISVFIEDMVLVTGHGAEVLTAELPRSPQDLERMVSRTRSDSR
jgi:Xaa-Pro aminopeptidase